MLNAPETHSFERKIYVTHATHAVTKQVVRRWRETKEERHDDLQGVLLARHDMGRIAPVLRQARRSRADRGGG